MEASFANAPRLALTIVRTLFKAFCRPLFFSADRTTGPGTVKRLPGGTLFQNCERLSEPKHTSNSVPRSPKLYSWPSWRQTGTLLHFHVSKHITCTFPLWMWKDKIPQVGKFRSRNRRMRTNTRQSLGASGGGSGFAQPITGVSP